MLGVEHDSQSGTHSLGWQVGSENGTHDTISSMSLNDSPPHGSVLCVLLYRFSLVNVNDSLAKVVGSSLSVIHSFEVEKSLVLMLISLASSESQEFSLNPQSIAD